MHFGFRSGSTHILRRSGLRRLNPDGEPGPKSTIATSFEAERIAVI